MLKFKRGANGGREMSAARSLLQLVAVICSLMMASAADANSPDQGLSPTTRCENAKLRAAGAYFDCLMRAEAAANRWDRTPSEETIKRCDARFDRRFERAEAEAAGADCDGVLGSEVDSRETMRADQQNVASGGTITPIGETGCYFYVNVYGKVPAQQGDKINGVQCPLTSSFDGTTNNPIPLATDEGLIGQLNDWFIENSKGVQITTNSYVGIEAFGGRGNDGDSCGSCTSGGGAGGGYAVTVQTLSGMIDLIQNYNAGAATAQPVALFGYVGRKGSDPDDQRGGGGGSASLVIGLTLALIDEEEIMHPDGMLVYVMAGGGGARVSGSGGHGGEGGRMNDAGPQPNFLTVAGEDGNGSNHGTGGSKNGNGVGGGLGGGSGIGGEGGTKRGWVDSTTSYPYGMGGPIGGDKGTGGAGGGGWGGGGGGGESDNQGGGGAGGGTWARTSAAVSPDVGAIGLPMIYNLEGPGFSVSDAGFSQIILSFSTEPTS